MSGNIKQSEEQGVGKKPDIRPRWRKKRWWAVGLFLAWYLHPLVWQIPGLWYLPLPLQCEYGGYDSAAIRKLVREARAMRGDYVVAVPYSTGEFNQKELVFPLDQFFQDFVSRAENRDELLARIHAYMYALGGTIIYAPVYDKSDEPGDVSKNTFTLVARINYLNLGYLLPIPLRRMGHIRVNVWSKYVEPSFLSKFDRSSWDKISKAQSNFEDSLVLRQGDRLGRLGVRGGSYWPFSRGRNTAWGIVNECFDATNLPNQLKLHQQNLTEVLGLTPETRGFKVYKSE